MLPIIAIFSQAVLAQIFEGLMSQAPRLKCLSKNSYFFPFLGEEGNSVNLNASNRDLKLPPRGKKTRYAAIRGAGNTDILLPSL